MFYFTLKESSILEFATTYRMMIFWTLVYLKKKMQPHSSSHFNTYYTYLVLLVATL